MQGFEFNTVGRIVNGPGSALELAEQCRRWVSAPVAGDRPGPDGHRPGAAGDGGAGDCRPGGSGFDQVREDPPEATVLAAAELGRSRV